MLSGIVRVYRIHDLSEVVFCLRLSGLVLNCFESGKEQADQNRHDTDDNKQFDESKCGGGISSHSAGIMALTRASHKFFSQAAVVP